jgi:tetratricopeptide (TPR) repeat protein/Zn-dependent membrane protease YugP
VALELLSLAPLVALLVCLSVGRRIQRAWQQPFLRYAGEPAACGLPGQAIARKLLDSLGLSQVAVVKRSGFNRYRPWRQQVCLNGAAFDETSLSALVVAAHEVGHAQQFAVGFLPARLWKLFQPVLMLLAVGGMALVAYGLSGETPTAFSLYALLPAFVVSVFLIIDMLLLEYDATRRAKDMIGGKDLIAPGERQGFNLLLNRAFGMHVLRVGAFVGMAVLGGAMCLINNVDWWADSAADIAAPRIVAPPPTSLSENRRGLSPFAMPGEQKGTVPFSADGSRIGSSTPPPPAAREIPQEVLNIDLDLTTPLLWTAGILAIFLALPVSRRLNIRRAALRCAAARTLQSQGAFEAAIAEYNKSLRLDRKQLAAYVGRGTALLLAGRLEQALADFDTANRIAPGVAGLLVTRGTIHLRRENFELALADFNEALRLIPDSVQALVARGNLWLMRHDLDGASADFEHALASNPNDVAALRGRCHLRLARNELNEALADIEQVFARGEPCADSYALRGRVYEARKEFAAALADLQTAIELAPNRADLYRDRGLVCISQGDFERAIADASHAIRLDPNDGVAFNNRGAALSKSGDYAAAIADLREAIRLRPSLPNPCKHLAWIQATCPLPEFRDGAAAVANATRALELANWKPVEWLATLAAAHAEHGNFGEARRWQRKCLDESPTELSAELRARLELYEAGEPFREEPAIALSQRENDALPLTTSKS